MICMIDVEFGFIVMLGDVVFVGFIGCIDMLGGDFVQMLYSFFDVVWFLDDFIYVLFGYGGLMMMVNECLINLFLGCCQVLLYVNVFDCFQIGIIKVVG